MHPRLSSAYFWLTIFLLLRRCSVCCSSDAVLAVGALLCGRNAFRQQQQAVGMMPGPGVCELCCCE